MDYTSTFFARVQLESLVHKDPQERRVNLEYMENQEAQDVKASVET